MTKKVGEVDEPITHVELEERVNAGIQWKSIGSDMVPIFEEHSVRVERGHTLESWYALQPMERAIMVAQKRIENSMKNHYSEAEANKMRNDAKKGARKR